MKSFFIICTSALYFNIVNTFTPFIKIIYYKTNGLIKSLSGILETFSSYNKNKFAENPNSIIETDLEKFIMPGYMEHDPKIQE
jgi:hypothetical protein